MIAESMPHDATAPELHGPARLPFPQFRERFPWVGPDLQTVRNSLWYRPPAFPRPGQRLLLPLGDGDQLWATLDRPDDAALAKPLIVLIHGLTGDENSRNIRTSAAFHVGRGHTVLRLNLRGAGPSLGQSRGHYHAGRSEDLRLALAAVPASLTRLGIWVVGVSLGGNMVLKFMAEDPPPAVRGAVAVSAPVDLAAAQRRIMTRRNWLYHRHLLRQMKADAAAARDPAIAPALLGRIDSVLAFDDLIVAPRNGFADAEDYYARASAAPVLGRIAGPTLVLHAADDPWIPVASHLSLPWPAAGNVSLLVSPGGGHVGFHDRASPIPWHDRCVALFIDFVDGSTTGDGASPGR